MSKQTKPLTNLEIKKASYKDGKRVLNDGRGLKVIIRPSEKKSFQYHYKLHGKWNTYTIGMYGDISLQEAREEHRRLYKSVREGVNPRFQNKINENAATNTFKAVAEKWMEKRKRKWSSDHERIIRQRFAKNIFPFIGEIPVSKIDFATLERVIEIVEERDAFYIAKRTCQNLNQVFRYAKSRKLCEHNIADGLSEIVTEYDETSHRHMNESDLPEFMFKLQTQNPSSLHNAAVYLLALTFPRPSIVRKAKWSEIKWNESIWIVPANRMKKNREFAIPLSKQAITLLKKVQEKSGNREYIFPSSHLSNAPYSDATFRKYVNFYTEGKSVPYGFRHIASTILHEKDFDTLKVGKQMSHEDKKTSRKAYNKAEYLPYRIEMMQKWADYLDQQYDAYEQLIEG